MIEWLHQAGLWPATASPHAAEVDTLLWMFILVLVVLAGPVFVAMSWFAYRYRAGREGPRQPRHRGNARLEVAWMVIPFVIASGFYLWASALYLDPVAEAGTPLVVQVEAKQWMWKFQHPTGQREINTLHVPAGRTVDLRMRSQDVIHSLYLPALRLKHDVVPGRMTRLRFVAEKPGTYHLQCAEYCGTAHARMGGRLVVLAEGDYQRWLDGPERAGGATR